MVASAANLPLLLFDDLMLRILQNFFEMTFSSFQGNEFSNE